MPDGRATIDWTKILGRDPSKYDESGIDAHMLVSTEPRLGLAPPSAADDADPVHGREWRTGGSDLEHACTFPLYEVGPDGKSRPASHVCAAGDKTCTTDCNGTTNAPLCAKDDPRRQIRGKAYPTRRALTVARDLGDRRRTVTTTGTARQFARSPIASPASSWPPAFRAS